MDWNEILAVFINTVVVMVAVQGLKAYVIPWIKANAPWTIPLIAQGLAWIVTYASNWLTAAIGYPVDLSPIVAVFTGLIAVGAFDVLQGAKKSLAASVR